MAERQPYLICGPQGQTLYPSTGNNPNKYRRARVIKRDLRLSITQLDHAQMVSDCTQLACRIPVLGGALRQMSEWAFAGDSWQPIYYGEDEAWGDIATDWLVHEVFPNCVRRTPYKSLIKALQVSAKSWLAQGDDLALFGLDEQNNPKMTVIPATAIGNGDLKSGWWAQETVTSGLSNTDAAGYGICQGGRFDGARIYNGIIYDDNDEPVAARVLGRKRGEKGFESTFHDFQLGFAYGAHMAFPYDWHGMGRPMPRIASAATAWKDFEERDDLFQKGIKLAATKTVIHQLAEGQGAAEARGDAAQQITVTDENGNEQTIFVEATADGDVTYIGSGENLKGLEYANPHPDVEAFAVRKLRECVTDLGWLLEMINLSDSGRAPTRLGCDLVNNSIWNLQVIGEERLFWFVKFAIAAGQTHKKIPALPVKDGAFDEPYRWTFGYPKEMSVDAGNDVTASLNRLRYGLTSQRVESAKWGYVLKRVRKDRQKEVRTLIDDAADLKKYAKDNYGEDIPFLKAIEFFYQPSANAAALPAQGAESQPPKNDPANKANPGAK